MRIEARRYGHSAGPVALAPPLICPRCRHIFPQLALNPFADVADCSKCNGHFQLSEVSSEPSDHLIQTPAQVSTAFSGDHWLITATPDSRKAFVTWIIAIVWIVFVVWTWTDARHTRWSLFVQVWLLACWSLFLYKAALQTLGRYLISGSSETWTVSTALGWIHWKRSIRRAALTGIRLHRERVGRGGVRSTIVLEANRKITFGEELRDDQRRYIAAFLLQKAKVTHTQTDNV
jgi:hypothetical protein